MKNKKTTILLLLMFLLCVVAGCNKGTANSSAEEAIQPKDTTPAIEISAGDLAKEWEANRAATDEKYAGKTLAIASRIKDVYKTAAGGVNIILDDFVMCEAEATNNTKELESKIKNPKLSLPMMTFKGIYSKGSPDSPAFKIKSCEPLTTLADMKNSMRTPMPAADCPTSIFSNEHIFCEGCI